MRSFIFFNDLFKKYYNLFFSKKTKLIFPRISVELSDIS
jgi:hypothetical protein